MADVSINFDISDFIKHTEILSGKVKIARLKALATIADELLRLSQFEVPFATGELMSSGVSKAHGTDEYVVGYNKVYAARLHEHPEYHFKNGRKGKYLEDPMKMNKEIFTEYFGVTMRSELGML